MINEFFRYQRCTSAPHKQQFMFDSDLMVLAQRMVGMLAHWLVAVGGWGVISVPSCSKLSKGLRALWLVVVALGTSLILYSIL